MCLSAAPAHFSNTILYAGLVRQGKKPIHVIGYQNTAENHHSGPNCMILPLQSKGAMGPGNILDTSGARNLLKDMRSAITPRSKGLAFGATRGIASDSMKVQVFDHDVYTICLGRVGANFKTALKTVGEDRRPTIPAEILKFFETYYRNYHLAVCCFNNREAQSASPMLWQYEPVNPDVIVAPAIDGHDGFAPRPGTPVDLDHVLIASGPNVRGATVDYTDKIPSALRPYLPESVVGQMYDGESAANGDFLIDVTRMGSKLGAAVRRGILPIAA
jgi:hypothetical protein